MGYVYAIECSDCGYKKEIYEGSGMVVRHNLYYCTKCNEISTTSEEWNYIKPKQKNKKVEYTCESCCTKLKKFEIIRKSREDLICIELTNYIAEKLNKPLISTEDKISISIPIKCKHCKSKNIKITEIGLWD